MCSTCGARLCLSAMLSNRKGTKQHTKHRNTMKHMRVTRLNSPSSPEVAEWEEDAAVVDEVGAMTIPGGGLLDADEFKAVAGLWADGEAFLEVISSLFCARSAWLLTSQLRVLTMPLCTPLSSVPCTEEAGFFLDDRRLSL